MLPPIQAAKNEATQRMQERSPQVSFKISAGSNDNRRSPLKQRPPQRLPPNEMINLELMNNFGGHDQRANTDNSKLVQLKLENQSILSTGSPERRIPFDTKEDKLMREILDGYQKVMSSGQGTKENLYLKKIRFHHPIFRELSYNAYKMIFDLCEIIQIKKGQVLYKQDLPIQDIYFVMHGKVGLRYFSDNEVEDLDDAGFLGQSMGEEVLFYEEKTYRETAVCTTPRSTILQLRAEYIFELGDESFMNRGLGSEAMKNDMDHLFERLSHIYN
jgi:hypothetical protein